MWHPLYRPSLIMSGTTGSGIPSNADSAVVFLGHFNGADATTSASDSAYGGAAPHDITFVGNAQLDTAQKKFGTASLLLDGTGDHVSMADSDDWYFDGDHTIEAWVRFNTVPSASTHSIFYQASGLGSVTLDIYESGGTTTLRFNALDSLGANVYSASGAVTVAANTWYHVAGSFDGTTARVLFDGVVKGSDNTIGTMSNLTGSMIIGSNGASQYFDGWIDEVRITNGYCWYRSDFDVPTAAFTGLIVTPSSIANLELWIEARKETAYSDGDSVSTATDQSGNNNDGTNTGTNRPVYKTSIINGEAVYRFDGTTQWLDFGTQISKPTSFTALAVFNVDTTTPNTQTFLGSCNNAAQSGTMWAHLAVGNGFSGCPQGALVYNFGISTGTYSYGHTTSSHINISTDYIVSTRYTGGDNYQEYFVDNELRANDADWTSASAIAGTNYGLSVGRTGEYDGYYVDGDIAAVLLYTGALTDQQLQDVTRYLASVFT